MGFANFHIHTYFSDGMTGPGDLARAVYAEADLEFMTITDHDSMSAVEPFYRVRESYESEGRHKSRQFVPGVELSLQDPQTGGVVHLVGLFPRVTVDNHREELARIDGEIGEFCQYRCKNRAVKDLDARIHRAYEINLDGLADLHDSAETVIGILRNRAGEKNGVRFTEAGKEQDVIQHPIPITYQTIIDYWEELVPQSTRERITLYILRPDQSKIDRLTQLYIEDGMTESQAASQAETNQGILLTFRKPVIKELSALEGLDLLQQTGAVSIIAHPAVDHKKISYPDFDHYILDPLIANGLDGIEVLYPYDLTYRQEAIQRYGTIAAQHDLLVSGGTDYHGDGRTGLSDVKLGLAAALRILNHR
jgi:hypothetical protein